jgi:ABC-2 type transport system ATP-binding protein
MIIVKDVVFDYPASRALRGVSFEVTDGAVLALVGPNGAGKTTLLRCMAALDPPTSGTIGIAGLDVVESPRAVHRLLGFLPDFFGLYDELTVRQCLIYAARSREVGPAQAPAAAEQAAARVKLGDRLESRAGQLSRGLRQRLAIAQTIVHSPRVLLLDEPAAGLDPEARRDLSELITRLAGDGMTIIVSSHILAELEDYSTRMLMLRDGAVAGGGVVEAGSGAQTREREAVEVVFAAPPPDLEQTLTGLELKVVSLTGATAVIEADDGSDIVRRLVEAGLSVRSFTPVRRTLEQAYLAEAAAAPADGRGA